jgi:ADP-ribosyl-[dinitrogen reductase] hydrolase
MNMQQKIASSLLVAIVGDALGVPVESTPRSELSLCSVKNMLGYGRFDHPQGTWSDDTSMILCTLDSFLRNNYDIEDLGKTFCEWIFNSYWTPNGYVFDSGLTTFLALDRIRNSNISAFQSGGKSEEDNGNGSLMRILPAALYFHREETGPFLQHIHDVSAITHAHPRALIGCGIYSLLVRELLQYDNKNEALRQTATLALEYYKKEPQFNDELSHYMRILSLEIPYLTEADINSSGYIIDTLEASIWCFFKHTTSYDIILSAVNLGLDTDTTGAVAGGLGGLLYGTDSIPADWLNSLARKNEIQDLINRFAEHMATKQ